MYKMDYKPAIMRLMVAQETGDPKQPYKHIFGSYRPFGDLLLVESKEILPSGIYYAYAELDWTSPYIDSFTLNAIGYNIKAKEVEHNKFPDFIKE